MKAFTQVLNSFMKSKAGKTSLKILLVVLVLAVIYWILKKFMGNIGEGIENWRDDRNTQEVCNNTPTIDGTTMTTSERNAFKPQAKIIADQQHSALSVTTFWIPNTDENAVYNGIIDLNGAQLQMVWCEFGYIDDMDLFTWYAQDFSNTMVVTNYNVGSYGLTEEQVLPYATSHGVVNDASWNIGEENLLKAIWEKSGLPLGF